MKTTKEKIKPFKIGQKVVVDNLRKNGYPCNWAKISGLKVGMVTEVTEVHSVENVIITEASHGYYVHAKNYRPYKSKKKVTVKKK